LPYQVTQFCLGLRNRVLGEAAAARLKPEGGDVRYLAIDLGDSATIARAAQAIDADFGHLDVVVNNAGIVVQGGGMLSGCSPDAVSVAVTQAMLPLLRKAPSASIVNVAG
jgi:NAD(P)-dependent dehydrogenase (short-subunit alcohol dehydrogenase family)